MEFAQAFALLVMMSSIHLCLTQRSGKVSFPDAGPAPARPAAQAESRLLADANGSFGLSDSSAKPRNIGFLGELDQRRRRPGCPLCDDSVYSYCDDKLLHDACCCQPPQQLPPQCTEADCRFLHAKSCYEHRLITRCCCDLRSL